MLPRTVSQRKQRIALEHDAAIGPRPGDRPAAQADLARGRLHESADEIEQGALAAAARPDDGDELVLARRTGRSTRAPTTAARAVAVAHGDVAQLQARTGAATALFGQVGEVMYFATSKLADEAIGRERVDHRLDVLAVDLRHRAGRDSPFW